ncbi:hypothetical protein SAMN06298226_0325 [Nitrosovibrio sp. Nv4]|nr:hypothetical protein SAMN06298226_0325 [Nitrosovibrio sp. Nv4]
MSSPESERGVDEPSVVFCFPSQLTTESLRIACYSCDALPTAQITFLGFAGTHHNRMAVALRSDDLPCGDRRVWIR